MVAINLLRKKIVRDIYYWRTKEQTEIDFIVKTYNGDVYPLEVKSKNPSRVPRSFHSFYTRYPHAKDGFLTSQDIFDTKTVGNHTISLHPYWCL